MATTRIFDTYPYLTEATATVLYYEKIENNNEPLFAIVLDQTIFFPEEGGQSPDKGYIEDLEVIDVQVKNKVIYHYVKERLPEGKLVSMKLDFAHRFSNMQQHSGEHIFSGLVHSIYGFDNVGFHLSDNSVTMDFNGILSADDVNLIETKVNEAISKNIEIDARYVADEELKNLNYRSKKELEGPVRIVTIEGYDTCACCAPHVKRTGEIGMLKVIHVQNYKGGVRINILCGQRALIYYRESLNLIDSLTDFLTTGRENLLETVERLKNDTLVLSSKLNSAKLTLLMNETNSIPAEQENVILFKEKTDSNIMRNIVNSLVAKHNGLIAFFSGSDDTTYSYILSSETVDVKEVQKNLSESLNAKGGGKPPMISGSVSATKEQILDVLKEYN